MKRPPTPKSRGLSTSCGLHLVAGCHVLDALRRRSVGPRDTKARSTKERVDRKADREPHGLACLRSGEADLRRTEREADGDAHYGVWESNINAILPDGEGYSDYAGDCYMRGLICRVTPVETELVAANG